MNYRRCCNRSSRKDVSARGALGESKFKQSSRAAEIVESDEKIDVHVGVFVNLPTGIYSDR